MGEKIRAKEISIANKSKESIDNLLSSIKHKCPACGNDKFTMSGSRIMIVPPFSNSGMGYSFSLTGICTKCSRDEAIDISGIIEKIFSEEERDKLIEECKEMNSLR